MSKFYQTAALLFNKVELLVGSATGRLLIPLCTARRAGAGNTEIHAASPADNGERTAIVSVIDLYLPLQIV